MATVVGAILTLKIAGFYTGLVYLAMMTAAASAAAYQSSTVWNTLPFVLLSVAMAVWAYRVDAENENNSWALTYSDAIPYLVIVAAASTALPLLIGDFIYEHNINAVVRVFMFKLTASILSIILSVVFYDLTKQFDSSTSLLDSTDKLKCNTTATTADDGAIISSSNTPDCPYKEWDHMRYIVLLLVQVYCTYLLTTESQFYKGINNKLVLGEATMWTLASITQLNVVKEWYSISLTTILFMLAGSVCYVARIVHKSTSPALNASGSNSPITAEVNLLSKLKL